MSFNHISNSIDELIQIFKHYQTDGSSRNSYRFNNNQKLQQSQLFDFQGDSSLSDQFSFSIQKLPKMKIGLHSSLQKIDKRRQPLSTIRQMKSRDRNNDSSDSNIFSRLYEENKVITQRRERLFQEGRRSLQAKEGKECTFTPNSKSKLKTERACRISEVEAFYQKNLDWQLKKSVEIKKKLCDKNGEEKSELTFAPKVNPYRKKYLENKQNSQYLSIKRKPDSYLQNYQKLSSCKQSNDNSIQSQVKCIWNMKKGYFSYAR